jgi:hypothetical protein
MNATSRKLKALTLGKEDFEWYPTTDEILKAMNSDLHGLFVKDALTGRGNSFNRRERLFSSNTSYNYQTKKSETHYTIYSFLDVGAGDGRVFDALRGINGDMEIDKRYGIEIAKAQADDLINRDIFIIGRDFFRTTLIDKWYSVIFSNPPYSRFVPWVEKLLKEANFGVMYLVLPLRWKSSIEPKCGIELYDVKIIGSFDFLDAERKATKLRFVWLKSILSA